jgi:hypothetical protein
MLFTPAILGWPSAGLRTKVRMLAKPFHACFLITFVALLWRLKPSSVTVQ